MPVFNGMPHLQATLKSIAEQTYGNQSIIAWDNGSTDGSVAELNAWIPDRIPGTVVVGRPLPLGECRAALVELAKTELIACTDADDTSLPERIAKQVATMSDDTGLVALGCVPHIVDQNDELLPDWYYPTSDAEIRWRTNWQCSLSASSVMFRRDAVLAAGNYRTLRGEDLDLWMRLSRMGRIESLPEKLVRYRRHLGNRTAAVVDFYDIDRSVAKVNATFLFPHLAADEAMRFWEAAYPRTVWDPVELSSFSTLETAAIRFARQSGRPDRYFTDTSYYSLQRSRMIGKILCRTIWSCAPVIDRASHVQRRVTRMFVR